MKAHSQSQDLRKGLRATSGERSARMDYSGAQYGNSFTAPAHDTRRKAAGESKESAFHQQASDALGTRGGLNGPALRHRGRE